MPSECTRLELDPLIDAPRCGDAPVKLRRDGPVCEDATYGEDRQCDKAAACPGLGGVIRYGAGI